MARIKSTPAFRKELKQLSKKHRSLYTDFENLLAKLAQNPKQGTPIGRSCYKIRLAISSKGKGKSGGARVISFVQIIEDTVYLLSIYDKSEKESISDAELTQLLENM